MISRPEISRPGRSLVARKAEFRVVSGGGLAMPNHSPSALDQLGDEIAVLSAHLDAATARLLDLIREFDARGGWNSGFRSCAAWLSWRGGVDLWAPPGGGRGARAPGGPALFGPAPPPGG